MFIGKEKELESLQDRYESGVWCRKVAIISKY